VKILPLPALALALLIGSLTAIPYLGFHFEYLPGSPIDARLSMFLLEHGHEWVTGKTLPAFLDAPFFYPVRGVIAYSETFAGLLPFYAPWRLLGFDRETSFQILIAVGFWLNFLATAWVLAKLRFHWIAALFGGYIFAFSMAALAQIGHSQLHYRFGIPLAWYFFYRFLEQFSWKDLFWCLLFVAWQSYCSLYEGYFLGVFLAVFALVTMLRRPVLRQYLNQAATRSVVAQAAVLVGFLAAMAALALPYMSMAGDAQLAAVRREETIQMLPRPVSYLMSWPGNYETGWLYERADVPLRHEHAMFVGLIPWACVCYLLFTRKKSGRQFAVVSVILAMLGIVLLTLYVNGVSLYFVPMQAPGIVAIRAVTRWILVLLLPFSIAVAQVVHLCQEKLQNTARPLSLALLAAAVAALVVENHVTPYRFLKAEARERLRALENRLPANVPREAILAYLHPGVNLDRQLYDLDAMLLAQDKHIVTVNGYSGREPNGYRPLRTCADLKHDLDDTPQQNITFPLQNAAKRLIIMGAEVDALCQHLDAPSSVQSEPLPERAFRAKLEVHAAPSVATGSPVAAELRVTNQSDVAWRARGLVNGKYAIRVGCRWLKSSAAESASSEGYNDRFDLAYDLAPGDTYSMPANFTAPATPGDYTLECDAVQELVHWFHSMGSPVGKTPLVVTGYGPPMEGSLDRADNQRIEGWVWERDHPNSPVDVEIYEGETRLATIPADVFRPDLLAAHKGNGAHSFSYSNPKASKRAGVHRIRVLVFGTKSELPGSPKEFSVAH